MIVTLAAVITHATHLKAWIVQVCSHKPLQKLVECKLENRLERRINLASRDAHLRDFPSSGQSDSCPHQPQVNSKCSYEPFHRILHSLAGAGHYPITKTRAYITELKVKRSVTLSLSRPTEILPAKKRCSDL